MLNETVRGHDSASWRTSWISGVFSAMKASLAALSLSFIALLFAGCSVISPEEDPAQEEIQGEASDVQANDAESNPIVDDQVAFAEPNQAPNLEPRFQDAEELLDERVRRERLMQERNRILIDRALDSAQGHVENNEYVKAEEELLGALALDPTNSDVLRDLEKVQELLGKRGGEISALRQRAADLQQVKREQLRFEADSHYDRAQELMNRGDYDEAIMRLETVLNHVRWSSAGVDWGDLPDRAESALEEARTAKNRSDRERQEAIEEETFRRLKEEEESEQAKRDAQVNALMVAAITEFETEKYAKAEALAGEVLKVDPSNDQALEIQASSKQAAREKRESDYIRDRKERYLRWKEEIEETRIPYHGIFNEPDPEYWDFISSVRSSELGLALPEIDPETLALQRAVASERMPANFEDAEIDEVATTINAFTGIPVNVDPETRIVIEDASVGVNLVGLQDVRVESLLNLVTEQLGEEISWTIRNGTVIITNKTKALGEPLIRVHPIQDIALTLQNFQGPKIDEIPLPNDSLEGFDEGPGPFGGPTDSEVVIEPDQIKELIESTVAPGTWEAPYICEVATSKQLLVIHTPEVQRQVASFLDDLRRFTSTVVTIDSRFVTITDAFIEDIGADFRGLGNEIGDDVVLDDSTIGLEDGTSQGLDNEGSGTDTISGSPPAAGVFFNDNSDGDIRARTENFFSNPLGSLLNTVGGGAFQFSLLDDTQVNLVFSLIEKSANATVINKASLTVFNTNRAFVTVLNEVSYLQGFSVDVANSAFIANPNIAILQEGVVLDVKPTISYDRKYITMDIQTTVADIIRPIPEFEASLGGFSAPVTFQLPELKVSSTSTTVQVPDGGSLVLGGMKKIRYINRRAGVPWFSKIPILGFFFSEKGVSDEVENVIVVVRASITDMAPLRDALSMR